MLDSSVFSLSLLSQKNLNGVNERTIKEIVVPIKIALAQFIFVNIESFTVVDEFNLDKLVPIEVVELIIYVNLDYIFSLF